METKTKHDGSEYELDNIADSDVVSCDLTDFLAEGTDQCGALNGNISLEHSEQEVYYKEDVDKRKQLVHWFFTWNNYPQNGVVILETLFKDICKKYIFQEETGAKGTPHLQGCISLKKKMRWSEFNLPKQISWFRTRNLKSAYNYCMKEDTRTGKIYSDSPIIFKTKECRATEEGHKPKPLPAPLEIIEELRPWQQSVVKQILVKPDKRTINWVYDRPGCNGKTVFGKYLWAKHNAIVANEGGTRDISCMLACLKKNGRDLNLQTTFIFNFSRCKANISYGAIEYVKDGCMFSAKYESEQLMFNCPHVWIFSNDLPDFTKMSEDRWRVWVIDDNHSLMDVTPLKKIMFPDTKLSIQVPCALCTGDGCGLCRQ